jgi:hypothetical protein
MPSTPEGMSEEDLDFWLKLALHLLKYVTGLIVESVLNE